MNVYAYHPEASDSLSLESINNYAKSNGFSKIEMIREDDYHNKWEDRNLGKKLTSAESGDIFITHDSINFANSASEVLDILISLIGRNISLHFSKYNMKFTGAAQYNFSDLVNLLRKIEADFVSNRNLEAIEHRRNMGVILGRPKGRKNKALKLDKYKKEITRYLELSISKASIAKLVNCHPQTLYDWIERNSIPDRKPRKPRVKKEQDVRELA